jgi:carboxyl-terminal processing protease
MMQMADYLKRQNLVEQFANYGASHGLQRRNLMIQKSRKLLDRYINSRIIYNMLNEEAWTQYLNQDDPVLKKALEVFRNGEAFPKKPEANKEETKKQKVAQARTHMPYMPLNTDKNIIVRC